MTSPRNSQLTFIFIRHSLKCDINMIILSPGVMYIKIDLQTYKEWYNAGKVVFASLTCDGRIFPFSGNHYSFSLFSLERVG